MCDFPGLEQETILRWRDIRAFERQVSNFLVRAQTLTLRDPPPCVRHPSEQQ
jgi:hypothetical protein